MFCEDFSSYRHIYPLKDKTKESVFNVFIFYIAMAERQSGCKIKQFRMDRGSEFLNDKLLSEIRHLGIILHLTAPYTPAKNGVSERGNRTVNTKARSMMLEASAPHMFWYEACRTAVFLTSVQSLPLFLKIPRLTRSGMDNPHLYNIFECGGFKRSVSSERRSEIRNLTQWAKRECLWDLRMTITTIMSTTSSQEKP